MINRTAYLLSALKLIWLESSRNGLSYVLFYVAISNVINDTCIDACSLAAVFRLIAGILQVRGQNFLLWW